MDRNLPSPRDNPKVPLEDYEDFMDRNFPRGSSDYLPSKDFPDYISSPKRRPVTGLREPSHGSHKSQGSIGGSHRFTGSQSSHGSIGGSHRFTGSNGFQEFHGSPGRQGRPLRSG